MPGLFFAYRFTGVFCFLDLKQTDRIGIPIAHARTDLRFGFVRIDGSLDHLEMLIIATAAHLNLLASVSAIYPQLVSLKRIPLNRLERYWSCAIDVSDNAVDLFSWNCSWILVPLLSPITPFLPHASGVELLHFLVTCFDLELICIPHIPGGWNALAHQNVKHFNFTVLLHFQQFCRPMRRSRRFFLMDNKIAILESDIPNPTHSSTGLT